MHGILTRRLSTVVGVSLLVGRDGPGMRVERHRADVGEHREERDAEEKPVREPPSHRDGEYARIRAAVKKSCLISTPGRDVRADGARPFLRRPRQHHIPVRKWWPQRDSRSISSVGSNRGRKTDCRQPRPDVIDFRGQHSITT